MGEDSPVSRGHGPVVRVMPVLFACRGCERDHAAREVVAALDRRGLGEAAVAGADAAKARARFPIYAVEGCEQRCAARWLSGHGVQVQRSFVLDPKKDPGAELERVARDWS